MGYKKRSVVHHISNQTYTLIITLTIIFTHQIVITDRYYCRCDAILIIFTIVTIPNIIALILIVKAIKSMKKSQFFLWRYLIFAIILLLSNAFLLLALIPIKLVRMVFSFLSN